MDQSAQASACIDRLGVLTPKDEPWAQYVRLAFQDEHVLTWALFVLVEKHGLRLDQSFLHGAQRLIDAGADIHVGDMFGKRPLYKAIGYSDILMAQLLLKNGASVNAETYCGKSTLHLACRRNDKKSVLLLLSHGADPHSCYECETPLGWWVSQRDIIPDPDLPEVVEAFVYAGASMYHKNSGGLTILKRLTEKEKKQIRNHMAKRYYKPLRLCSIRLEQHPFNALVARNIVRHILDDYIPLSSEARKD